MDIILIIDTIKNNKEQIIVTIKQWELIDITKENMLLQRIKIQNIKKI